MKLKNPFATAALAVSLSIIVIQSTSAFDDGGIGAAKFYGGPTGTGAYSDAFLSVFDPTRGETYYLGLGSTQDLLNNIGSLMVMSSGAGSLGEWIGSAVNGDLTGFEYNFAGLQNGCPAIANCFIEAPLPSGDGNFQMLISVGTGQSAPGTTSNQGFDGAMINLGAVLRAAPDGESVKAGNASWNSGIWGNNIGGGLGFKNTGTWDGNAFTPITAALLGAEGPSTDALTWAVTVDNAFDDLFFELLFDETTNKATFQASVVPVPAAIWLLAPALAFLARIRRNS